MARIAVNAARRAVLTVEEGSWNTPAQLSGPPGEPIYAENALWRV